MKISKHSKYISPYIHDPQFHVWRDLAIERDTFFYWDNSRCYDLYGKGKHGPMNPYPVADTIACKVYDDMLRDWPDHLAAVLQRLVYKSVRQYALNSFIDYTSVIHHNTASSRPFEYM